MSVKRRPPRVCSRHINYKEPTECDIYVTSRFSLNKAVGRRIKAALTSGRKESPLVKIDMPFDQVEFLGRLKVQGTKKRVVRGIQRFKIKKYEDLNSILGLNWHWRGSKW